MFKKWAKAMILGWVGLSVFFMPLGWALLVGAGVVGIAARDIVINRREGGFVDRFVTRAAQRREERQLGRSMAMEHGVLNQLHEDRLPAGMEFNYSNGRYRKFNCAGIENLVTSRAYGFGRRDVEYYFHVPDAAKARELTEKAQAFEGTARVFYDRDKGQYKVWASNAYAINELAYAAYPPRTVQAERNVDVVRQYLVPGCSSYEEAVKVLQQTPSMTPVRTFQNVSYTVAGRQQLVRDGESVANPLPDTLPAGAFLVERRERFTTSDGVVIPGNISQGPEVFDYVDKSMSRISSPSRTETSEVIFSDCTPESMLRTMDLGRGIGRTPVRAFGEGLNPEQSKVYLQVKDVSELAGILDGKGLETGSKVYLGRIPDTPGLYLSLDAEPGLLARLAPVDALPDNIVSKYTSMGLPEADVRWSAFADDVRVDGSAAAYLTDDVSLSGAKLNGAPLKEAVERLSNERLPEMDDAGLVRWLDDASRIESVSVKLSPADESLHIAGIVDGRGIIVDPVKLTREEYDSLSSRGQISAAEKKDLFMQVNGNMFSMYPAVGDDALACPIRDYAFGRKPLTVGEVKRNPLAQEAPKVAKKNKNSL